MLVISDTTAITNLFQIELLLLMKELYGEVIIPQSVYDELCELPSQKSYLDQNNWIVVKKIKDQNLYTSLLKRIDSGEAEAIVLALELKSDVLVMDEVVGRQVATELGLKIIGLIGVLVIAKKRGLIDSVKVYMDRLMSEVNFRISPKLYRLVLTQLGEL